QTMKRWVKLSTVCLLTASLLAACGGGTATNESANGGTTGGAAQGDDKISVVLVTPEKIGVNQFFTQMEDGLAQAAEDFDLETKVIESADATQVEQNLRAAVAEGYDLVITAAFSAA